MSEKNEGEGDNVAALPTEFLFDQSPVRAILQYGEPWFIGKDVCDILGIDNPSQAIGRLTMTKDVSLIHIRPPAHVKC
jgi:prophage antirepressor-like protein